jgi:hypothetical protein
LILLSFALLVMTERTGKAEPNAVATPPRHVEIKSVAPSENWPALEAVLTELLARLQVSVRFSVVPTVDPRQIMSERSDDPPSVARVWIDMHDPNRVTLYLTGDRADRMLVRHVPLVTRVDEVAREEIAHIVEATVDALLVGGRIGVATDEVIRPAPKPEPPPPPPRERRPVGPWLELGVAYEAQFWQAARPPLHSAAFFVGAGGRAGVLRPGVWISGEYRFPTTVENPLVNARLEQGAFRAVASLEWAASARFRIGAGVGGGLDLVRITPDVNEGARVDAAAARSAAIPMLRALLIGHFAFGSRSEAFAGFAADYDLLGTRYILRDASNADVPVFEPWKLRPTALVGVATDVLAY